jgi:hypothetical protein
MARASSPPFFVAVAQDGDRMVVRSCHRGLRRALEAVATLTRRTPGVYHAALQLFASDYVRGDVLDPGDVDWRCYRPSNTCSECCNDLTPQHLTYRCPLTAGNPVCDTIVSARRIVQEGPCQTLRFPNTSEQPPAGGPSSPASGSGRASSTRRMGARSTSSARP